MNETILSRFVASVCLHSVEQQVRENRVPPPKRQILKVPTNFWKDGIKEANTLIHRTGACKKERREEEVRKVPKGGESLCH